MSIAYCWRGTKADIARGSVVPVAIVTTQLRGLIIQIDSNGRRLPTPAGRKVGLARSARSVICKTCKETHWSKA